LFLRNILFKNPKEVQNIDEQNRLLRQKRDAFIDYWLVTYFQRTEMDLAGADLSGVDLSDVGSARLILSGQPIPYYFSLVSMNINLANARLTGANLTRVRMNPDFSGADLRHANLTAATLNDPNLPGAILRGVRASAEVKLSGTCLRDAVLDNADLTGANLTRCCLDNVSMDGVCLCGANLTKCRGVTLVIDSWDMQDRKYSDDISMYRHQNVILYGAYKETRITDAAGNETVVKEPVTLDEFNRMNTFQIASVSEITRTMY
jgi:hypothetical protein